MRYKVLLVLVSLLGLGSALKAQKLDTLHHDTIYYDRDFQNPIEFSRGKMNYLRLRNVIPVEIPIEKIRIDMISSTGNKVNVKTVVREEYTLIIPLAILPEKFYTLNIKNMDLVIAKRRILIR